MELTQVEKNRAKKLQAILTKLQNGENVQNRTLQNNLKEDEYAAIGQEWNDQKELREELKDKPSEIIEYEERLRKALFAYNKYDTYKNPTTIKRAKNNSDAIFESLLEYLQEIIEADPYLQEWFDRRISFEHGEEPSLDPISIPRINTSRSLDCQFESIHKQRVLTINQVKQHIVEGALNSLNSKSIDTKAIDDSLLKEKLKKLKAIMKK